MRRSIFLSVLATPCLTAALSTIAHGQNPPSAGGFSRLVPADTVVFVQATSIDALESKLRAIATAVDPSKADDVNVRQLLLAEFAGGISPEWIDGTRPLAVAVAISPKTMQPDVTYIVPTKSRDELIKALSAIQPPPPVLSDGDYVAWHSAKTTTLALSSEVNPFTQGLPSGVLAARVDLARVIAIYRPMIDMGLDQAQNMMSTAAAAQSPSAIDVEAMTDLYIDGARSFLDSAQRLDLAFDVAGSRLDISPSLTVAEKSDMDNWGADGPTGIEQAGGWVDPNASFAMLLGLDFQKMLVRAKPFFDAVIEMYPKPMRGLMAGYMEHNGAIAKLLGKSHAVSGDLGADGLRFTYYLAATDPSALIAEYERMLKTPGAEGAGVTIEGPEEADVAGVHAKRYHVKISAETMSAFGGVGGTGPGAEATNKMIERLYGKDGMSITLAPGKDRVAMVIGGDDAFVNAAIARLSKAPPATAPALAAAVSRIAKDNPCMVLRINVSPLMSVFESMSGSATGQASSVVWPPLMLDFRAGIAGRVWEGGFSCDVNELGQFVKSVRQREESKSAPIRANLDIRALQTAVTLYMTTKDGKPPSKLEALVVPDADGSRFYSADKLPMDPWGHAYVYTTDGKSFHIVSYGSDGKPGGVGDAADIESE